LMEGGSGITATRIRPWRARVFLNRLLLIALLVLAIVAPVLVYWTDQRMATHMRWDEQYELAISFWSHLQQAGGLIRSGVGSPNQTASSWAENSISDAMGQLGRLGGLDISHSSQLGIIQYSLFALTSGWPIHLSNFTNTQTTLPPILFSLSRDILFAYTNYFNYTNTSSPTGPPFWYSGPSPPDGNLLQQAVDLAVQIERVTGACFGHPPCG
jgi:hypothetical protein